MNFDRVSNYGQRVPASNGPFGSARLALTVVFFLHAAVFTNWVPRIPDVQENLGLTAGGLALVFLGIAAGPLVAIPAAGALAARLGSRTVVRAALASYCLALCLPALAPTPLALFAALFCLSAANGGLATAMNAHGVALQKARGKAMFSSLHSANSFGGLVGAGMGGLAAAAGISPAVHLAVVGIFFAVLGTVLTRNLLPATADSSGSPGTPGGTPLFAVPSRALLGLGVLAFCVFLAESSVTNWSAVYLTNALGTSPGLASAGFVVFAFAMAVSRLLGDRLTVAVGPVALTRISGLVAAFGLGIGVAVNQPAAAIAGLGLFGVGLAAAIPAALKAAGERPEQPGALGIAAVSTFGYFGFLAGPLSFRLSGRDDRPRRSFRRSLGSRLTSRRLGRKRHPEG